MLKSVSDLIELPYEEAKEELTKKITKAVTTGIHAGEKILMLGYIVEHSSEKEPVTNKDIRDGIRIPEEEEMQRDGLAKSMGRMQGKLQGYIGTNSNLPKEYYMREEVLSAYEAEHGVSLRTDFSEILDDLRKSHPITPEPSDVMPSLPGIPAGDLW